MVTFQQTGVIDAPVEKVFSCLADPRRIPEWRREVPGISSVSGPTEIGTTFNEEVRFMGSHQLLMKVVEFVPNRKLVIEAQSGMSMLPTQSFTFTPDGDKTRLDLQVSMRTSGLMRLMEPMLPAQLKKMWGKYFESLNQLVSR